ncbi:helix-turn-helix domain-containing protein [Pseudomonas sp. UBA1879]|uniref:helix-turn-helix domain-containing protein n=1 Tax=Pseudomonas sp. UBA1879 TaxID=1947305 RepID=UPI0025E8F06C|nr:helix-turn-helix transcriptional regulator [Pseudomonas sp. UBA1879]
MTLSEEIGARLREQRYAAGLTQDQVAEKLGVSKRTQGNYEAGSSDATASYLCVVERELGFDVAYILSGVKKTLAADTLSQEEDMVIKQYRSIPSEDQVAVRRFLKAMADDAAKQST